MVDEQHWDERYRGSSLKELSWYQDEPTTSLALLDALGVAATASIVDIGGGASTLVDQLVHRGHGDLAVLDLSGRALEIARQRTGDPDGVMWIHHDVLTWAPPRQWDVWHDRAALHFLVDDTDRATYVELLRRTIGPGGAFVIGAFAEDGPTQCSALPVRRYSDADLVRLLPDADIVARRREIHTTASGVEQQFNWIAGRLP